MMTRRMIETVFISDYSDMGQTAEENQRAKFRLLFLRGGRHGHPVRTSRPAGEIQTRVLKRAPHEARTIKRLWAGPVEMIRRSQVRLNRRQQELIEVA